MGKNLKIITELISIILKEKLKKLFTNVLICEKMKNLRNETGQKNFVLQLWNI